MSTRTASVCIQSFSVNCTSIRLHSSQAASIVSYEMNAVEELWLELFTHLGLVIFVVRVHIDGLLSVSNYDFPLPEPFLYRRTWYAASSVENFNCALDTTCACIDWQTKMRKQLSWPYEYLSGILQLCSVPHIAQQYQSSKKADRIFEKAGVFHYKVWVEYCGSQATRIAGGKKIQNSSRFVECGAIASWAFIFDVFTSDLSSMRTQVCYCALGVSLNCYSFHCCRPYTWAALRYTRDEGGVQPFISISAIPRVLWLIKQCSRTQHQMGSTHGAKAATAAINFSCVCCV